MRVLGTRNLLLRDGEAPLLRLGRSKSFLTGEMISLLHSLARFGPGAVPDSHFRIMRAKMLFSPSATAKTLGVPPSHPATEAREQNAHYYIKEMKPLSTQEKHESFLNTLSLCGLFLLNRDEGEIEYKIFEEFDSDIRAFLCDENLFELLNAGSINRKVFDESQKLRNLVLNLDCSELWNPVSVKTSPEWREIMLLCDKLRIEVKSNDSDDKV